MSCRTGSILSLCLKCQVWVFFFHCSDKDLEDNRYLALDPNVSGVYNGAYPFGIDPVSFILFNYPLVMITLCPLDFGMCISKINLTKKNTFLFVFSVQQHVFFWQVKDWTSFIKLKFQFWPPFEVEFWSPVENGCSFIPPVMMFISAGLVFSSDMEFGKQSSHFSKLIQNENVCDLRSDSHDLWSYIGAV